MISKEIILHAEFSCAHFYNQKKWSKEKNLAVFGKCHTTYGHGHDYRLEVHYDTGYDKSFDKDACLLALRRLTEKLDHKHLNFDLEFFKDVIPTTENLAIYCLKILQEATPHSRPIKIKLFESASLWVELDQLE